MNTEDAESAEDTEKNKKPARRSGGPEFPFDCGAASCAPTNPMIHPRTRSMLNAPSNVPA